MARTATISGSLVTLEGDPFDEGKDDYIELDLVDDEGEAIEDVAVTAITATLRSLDAGTVVNDRDEQDVLNDNGGTLDAGTFRLNLSGAGDLATVGSRQRQRRELTLIVSHTGGVIPLVVRFDLRAFADVG